MQFDITAKSCYVQALILIYKQNFPFSSSEYKSKKLSEKKNKNTRTEKLQFAEF